MSSSTASSETTADVAKRLYNDTLIAGPMVRGSSHIFRISCLEHGADVVFSPGLVDLALIKTTRVIENDHVVFYSESNGHKSAIFQTCASEKGKIVLQLVSNDSANAVLAASHLAQDVVAYDLNCGCPESFACHRGSGSAIELDAAVDIVKGLVRNTDKPVSVKFRVLPEVEKSIQFAKAVVDAGASAITIHGRLKEQKHKGAVDYEKMKTVFDSVKCLKIGNGGVASRSDAEKMVGRLPRRTGSSCDRVLYPPDRRDLGLIETKENGRLSASCPFVYSIIRRYLLERKTIFACTNHGRHVRPAYRRPDRTEDPPERRE